MKRFLAVSILAAAFTAKAAGCAMEKCDHNYYMFSVFQREHTAPAFIGGINAYWKAYAGDSANRMDEYYKWNKDEILSIAQKRGDKQMAAYLRWLNAYCKVSDDISHGSWDYPSKQDIARRRQTLLRILAAAKAYKGTRMRSQYALLTMRCNMILGYDKANIAYWNSAGSKLSASCWKEAMKNIYARAILKSGNRIKACDIYSAQGDMESIIFTASNYRNLAGIQSIYAKEPNSPTLTYLVQDFVNNVQQTIDSNPQSKEDKEWIETIGAKTIYKAEAQRFISFANKVVAEGKTESPCLWRSATAMLYYMLGENDKAIEDINDALSLKGTPRMKDNARCIRLLALTAKWADAPEFSNYLVGEMKWLDGKILEERGDGLFYDNHYTNVKERIVFRNLYRLYVQNGKPEMATALLGMMQKYANDYTPEAAKYLDKAYGSYSDYTERLDTMTAKETMAYAEFINSNHDDAFETYVADRVYKNAEFFNDMIGTKLIAEGNFSEAAKYLKNLSLPFISAQRIGFYMAQRSFSVPRWFKRQKPKDEEGFLYTDFADSYADVKENQKLQFCNEMAGLLSKYNILRDGIEKESVAYELAVRYYQASCYGDCWYLTHYGQSVNDSARTNEKDFAAEAVRYLKVCAASSDLNLRYKALYALAFIPVEPWCRTDYDYQGNEVFTLLPYSSQYKALANLDAFAKSHPEIIDSYTTKCDVLDMFRKNQ